MMEEQRQEDRLWEEGWDGHEKAQLLRLARLSLEDKIRWLEEAEEIAKNLQRRKSSSI
ncbi:MAG: hypothetical protein AB1512_24235 [Thermodesulfobacteriota bacterium]